MEFRAMREYGNTGGVKETGSTEKCVAVTIRKWMMGLRKRK
jgi:hypothetical protein